MILKDGLAGSSYTVKQIDLPLSLERRLEALGMTEGTQISVLGRKNHGAMIIKIRGTRFAVGYGITSHIAVSAA